MGEVFKGNKLEDSKSRERVIEIEEAKKVSKRREDSSKRETRQRNNNREESGEETGGAGGERGTTEETKQSEENLGLVVEDEPEQLILEVKEEKKKRKKRTKKTDNKLKDEIKLILVGTYGLVGATIDKCFYLKPSEADLLTEAIYRYLDEHNLLGTISEKTATVNLIIALLAVNTPKVMTYYKKLKERKEDKENDKGRKIKDDSGQSANGVSRRQYDNTNAKTHLDQFYQPNE